MGHTQQVCVRIVLLPLKRLATVFRRSAFLRQQQTDLPPAELWCACSFLLIGRYISVFCGRRTSNMTSPCRLLHSSSFKWLPTAVKQRCERCRTPWPHLLFFALLRSFQ
ncbi:hypothetical protein TNCV_4970151 [Trichonephila clavipes]|nr:hypothetical protein TNCV_4970151 [Trichonephila clavipes]